MKTFLKQHSLVAGLVLMFLYTWTIDLSNSGVLPLKVPFAVALTVGWGFIFVSLLMTWLTLGRGETVRLRPWRSCIPGSTTTRAAVSCSSRSSMRRAIRLAYSCRSNLQ